MIKSMEGFEKIELSNKTSTLPSEKKTLPQTNMNAKRKSKNIGRGAIILLGVLIVLILFSVFGIVLPGLKVYKQAKVTYAQAKVAIGAIKKQNITLASDELSKTKTELTKTQEDVKSLGYLKFIPIMNWYYNDGVHLLNAASYGLDAGQVLVDTLKPYADVLGLKGQGSFVGGTAQQRIQTAVATMSKITPKIDDVEQNFVLAKAEIDAVNPSHYPSFLGGGKIKSQLTQIRTITDEGVTFVEQAKPLIKVLPSLLGEPTDKKYLILFQNDKELRPTGGFMTAYAIFRLTHGVVHVDTSSDIYNLDATIGNHPPAPRPILQYLPKVSTWNLRDTNLSPDFAASMKDFNKLYSQAGAYQKVDGIVAVDTHALVSAMNILGDITTDGATFTTKSVPQCNCAQVIYQMEVYADQPVGFLKDNRKGLIGDLMYSIMQKAFSSSPKLYWGPLFQTMITEVAQKHVLFNVYNPDAQSGIESLNAGGKIIPFEGDYLHVNDTNFGGAKSNMFLSEAVDQNYEVKGDGSIIKTVKIVYKNPFAPSDCNLERGGLCLNAVQRDWLRVYVPKGSKLVSSQGSEVKVISYDELGKTVFEGFLTIRPLGSATYTLSYELPFKVNGSLPLLIQKQPGTDNNQYAISVKGTQVLDFPLLTDRTEKLSL